MCYIFRAPRWSIQNRAKLVRIRMNEARNRKMSCPIAALNVSVNRPEQSEINSSMKYLQIKSQGVGTHNPRPDKGLSGQLSLPCGKS